MISTRTACISINILNSTGSVDHMRKVEERHGGRKHVFFRGVVWWMDFLVILVIRSNFSANCFMRHRNDSCFGNAIPRSSRSVRDMVHAEQICMAVLDLVRSGTSITSNEYFPPEQKTMHWLAQIEISFCLLYKLNSYHACLLWTSLLEEVD